MVYGSKRLCLTSSLERPFRCLDFFNFVNLIDLILGAPLTMGGKMFNPLRLSAIVPSDPCIFNPLNLVSECVWNFSLVSKTWCIKFKLLFFAFTCFSLLWDAMSTVLARANKIPSYVSSSLYQYTQYITTVPKWGTPVHFECHSGINIKLEASIKKFSGKTFQFLPNWSFWRIFYIGMFSNLCC